MKWLPNRLQGGLPREVGWSAGLLLVGLGVTGWLALAAKSTADKEARLEFDFICSEIQARITERLDDQALILSSGAAFMSHGDDVTRQQWQQFAEGLPLAEKLPGIQGFGFARFLPRSDLLGHLRQVRAEGFPEYRVWPEGDREFYSAIVYLEPFSGRNLRAFGYDMFSEAVRRAAMERARDEGTAVLSGKVVLVQETGENPQAGTLMFVPVYRWDAPHGTLSERRAALVGWVYSPYRMVDLIQGVLGHLDFRGNRRIHLKIFDGEKAVTENLLYESQPAWEGNVASTDRIGRQVAVDSAGRRWLLSFAPDAGSSGAAGVSRTWLVAIGGTLTSLLLSGLAVSLANTRRNAQLIARRLTADLRESEARWQFAIEGSGDGVWDWDVPAGTVIFSRRWKELIGHSENEIGSGLDEWTKRVHPDDLPRVMADVQAYFDGRTTTYANEHRVRCKDGTWKWILDRGQVVSWNSVGKPLRMVGTHTDISARKEGELALRESEERFRRLFEDNRAVMLLIDGTDGSIVDANPAASAFYGWPREELLRRNIGQINTLSMQEMAVQLESARNDRRNHFQFRHRLAGGTIREVEVFATALNFAGRSLIHSIVHDTTTRNEAEVALKAAEARYRTIIQVSPVPMALNDERQIITYLNPAFVQTFGYTPEEIPTLADWWPKAYPDPAYREAVATAWIAELAEVKRCGSPFIPMELSVRCKDGTTKAVLGSGTAVLDSATGEHLVVLYDITTQKETQLALAISLKEKEVLLKEVHHRVKNNLQVVTSLLRLEMAQTNSEATRNTLDEMKGRIRSMALLHETLYRTEIFGYVDLAVYLKQLAIHLCRSVGSQSGEIRLQPELESVKADMDLAVSCGLLVNELITNSLKHGFPDSRGGVVRLELRRLEGGERIRLRVADDGVGLPVPFEYKSASTLGLQLVSDLVRQIGGVLEIGPGPGADFAVSFNPSDRDAKPRATGHAQQDP